MHSGLEVRKSCGDIEAFCRVAAIMMDDDLSCLDKRLHIAFLLGCLDIATTGALMWIFGGADTYFDGDFLMHVFAGGLLLGAFFMATDMVSSPITLKGQIIMGVGCGLLTFLVRLKGGPPEGVSYSILIMNAVTPLIDRYTVPRRFGESKS